MILSYTQVSLLLGTGAFPVTTVKLQLQDPSPEWLFTH